MSTAHRRLASGEIAPTKRRKGCICPSGRSPNMSVHGLAEVVKRRRTNVPNRPERMFCDHAESRPEDEDTELLEATALTETDRIEIH